MTPGGGPAVPLYGEYKTFNVKLSRISISIKTVCKRYTGWKEMHGGMKANRCRNAWTLLICICQATRDGFNSTQSGSLAALEPDIWWKRWERGRDEDWFIFFFFSFFHPETTVQLICMNHLWFNWLCWQFAHSCDRGRILVKGTSVFPACWQQLLQSPTSLCCQERNGGAFSWRTAR